MKWIKIDNKVINMDNVVYFRGFPESTAIKFTFVGGNHMEVRLYDINRLTSVMKRLESDTGINSFDMLSRLENSMGR